MGDRHGRLRGVRRHLQQLRDLAGRRRNHPRRCLRRGLSAAPRGADGRHHDAARENKEWRTERSDPHSRIWSPRLIGIWDLAMTQIETMLNKLRERFPNAITNVDEFRGDTTVTISRESLLDVARFLRDDLALHFEMLLDVTALDWLP